MVRPVNWHREFIPDFFWPTPAAMVWSETFAKTWLPGTTLTRIVGNLRFWVNAAESGVTNPNGLYAKYVWALLWDDGSIANFKAKTLTGNTAELAQTILYTESFSMRDAWTPPKYNGVNMGFIDDRTETAFETHSQRRSAPTAPATACRVWFKAQALSTVTADPIKYTPKISISFLTKEAGTV